MMENIKKSFKTSLYTGIPKKNRLLTQLERSCENRLKLYKLLQEAAHDHELYSAGWVTHLVEAISKEKLVNFLALLATDDILGSETKPVVEPVADTKIEPVSKSVEDSKVEFVCAGVEKLNILEALEDHFIDDEMGHFLFALIASTNKELKQLFVNLETQWLQLKFILNVPEESMTKFLKHYDIELEKASEEEILNDKLNIVEMYQLNCQIDTPTIFKLHFEKAPNLITNRDVVLHRGIMYFPNKRKYLSGFLHHTVTKQWKEKIDQLSKYWIYPERDMRIVMLVNEFTPGVKKLLHYTGEVGDGILTLKTIGEHSYRLFPLCMSQLHCFLKTNNHLKHNARSQYAVFLKNAGMAYEDAIELFKSEFTKKITDEDFRKQKYHYYFTHFFGKVGGMVNYPARSCEDIIENGPIGNQEHGCPFAHSDEKRLTNTLQQRDVKLSTIFEILDYKRNKLFRRACCLYFNEKIKSNLETVTSPNDYYVCALENKVVDIEDIFLEED